MKLNNAVFCTLKYKLFSKIVKQNDSSEKYLQFTVFMYPSRNTTAVKTFEKGAPFLAQLVPLPLGPNSALPPTCGRT